MNKLIRVLWAIEKDLRIIADNTKVNNNKNLPDKINLLTNLLTGNK